MLTPLPLVRDSAEPAFDQVNDHTFDFHPGIIDYSLNWADLPNWNDEALEGLSDHVAHLTLQRGTLNKVVIATLMRLNMLTSLEMVNVEIPSEIDSVFQYALMMAHQVKKIYYTGLYAPPSMSDNLGTLPATLYMKIGTHVGNHQRISAPNVQRLDAREALTLGGMNESSLVRGDELLDTLICRSENSNDGGKALAHLRVRSLILTGGDFGYKTALGLQCNTRMESVTLVDVPLKQEWVQQILRMSNLKSVTLVRPKPVADTKTAEPAKLPFTSGLRQSQQLKILFRSRA